MTIITRYDEISTVSTPLNPIDDLMSWISGLASVGYTSDILKTVHKMAIRAQITSGARLISVHAGNTIGSRALQMSAFFLFTMRFSIFLRFTSSLPDVLMTYYTTVTMVLHMMYRSPEKGF